MLGTVATLTPTTTYTGLGELPHFNPDDDRDPLHPAVAALRAAIEEASALLICTPEYAGGLPGSFKNLLDWTVGGGEIYGKPVAWINASSIAAPTGGKDAHDSLRKVLTYAGAKIVEEGCVRIPISRADVADGQVADPDLRGRIAVAVQRLREGV
ncbi:NADPH-dependent FMN reductase [Amycolatopsis sp. NPDC051102]|uniref:NADPH-dependent FMN reductase n=1 Tax=Amycolatopsis sp. NPDC051102 TaxID=3155163 RepID=UPI00342F1740